MKIFIKIILALLLLVIISCGQQQSPQYDTVSQARWSSTTIEVHWITKDKISDLCISLGTKDGNSTNVGEYNGCARSKPEPNPLNICEIYAVQPTSFDDTAVLTVFGHEAWHCFGAKHK